MSKLSQYIINGKGRGLLFLLAAAVILPIIILLNLKPFYSELKPQISLIADEFLPLTVANGEIVEPKDTYKRIDIKIGEDQDAVLPVILNTKDEKTELPQINTGIYITKDLVYLISSNKINKLQLKDGLIDKAQFDEMLDYSLNIFTIIGSTILIAVLFIIGLIKTIIAALFGLLCLKSFNKSSLLNFNALMRLSAIIVAAIEVIFFISGFYGLLHLSGMQCLLLEIVIVWLYILHLNKTQTA